MKKLLLILLALTLFNCSNDDDSQSVDPIVGEWVAYKAILPDYNDAVYDITGDIPKTFKSNNEYVTQGGNKNYFKKTWEKTSNSTYVIKVTYDYGGPEERTQELEWEANFFCNNEILEIKPLMHELLENLDEFAIIPSASHYYMKKLNYNENDCDEVTYPYE